MTVGRPVGTRREEKPNPRTDRPIAKCEYDAAATHQSRDPIADTRAHAHHSIAQGAIVDEPGPDDRTANGHGRPG